MEKWNAQRAQAVAHALLKVLYPLMEKEMRNKLLLEAKEHVLQVRVVDICTVCFVSTERGEGGGGGEWGRGKRKEAI